MLNILSLYLVFVFFNSKNIGCKHFVLPCGFSCKLGKCYWSCHQKVYEYSSHIWLIIRDGIQNVLFMITFKTGSSATTGKSYNLKRSHGLLNILGWGILIIMGAIVARYFKEWDPFWFYFHASVQSLGFVLGIVGVISGFVLNNQLHTDVSLHKALGIIIFVLGCLQVFIYFNNFPLYTKLVN